MAADFTWNINNELVGAVNSSGDSAAYAYDALGRRVARTLSVGGVSSTTWFFTNAWNVELEHNGTAFTRRLTWGLDLSGSLQGAGGVGGLVMVENLPGGSGTPVAHFPAYDGNGNITTWVDAIGTITARLRYDAYGNILSCTDGSGTLISPLALPSDYGFSTKPADRVTGMLYYGYRYYDPLTGRWPSRDPIGESGGMNLYGFVGNDGVGLWDYLGLKNWVSFNSDYQGKNSSEIWEQARANGVLDVNPGIGFQSDGYGNVDIDKPINGVVRQGADVSGSIERKDDKCCVKIDIDHKVAKLAIYLKSIEYTKGGASKLGIAAHEVLHIIGFIESMMAVVEVANYIGQPCYGSLKEAEAGRDEFVEMFEGVVNRALQVESEHRGRATNDGATGMGQPGEWSGPIPSELK
jgi:RHS repeat-associated protein